MKIAFKAPLNISVGYGHSARSLLRCLQLIYPDVKAIDVFEPNHSGCDIVFIHSDNFIGPKMVETSASRNIGFLLWETDRLIYEAASKMNLFSTIITSNPFGVEAYMKYNSNVHLVFIPLQQWETRPPKKRSIPRPRVYSIFDCIERKSPSECVEAFIRAFSGVHGACYSIKVRPGQRKKMCDIVNRVVSVLPKQMAVPNIRIYEDFWSRTKIEEFHIDNDIYLCLSKGEAWCLPMVDALWCGNAVVSTDVGAAESFGKFIEIVETKIDDVDMSSLDAYFRHVFSGSKWKYPAVNSAVECLKTAAGGKNKALYAREALEASCSDIAIASKLATLLGL